mmetsp:Transcript_64650/g.140794  ORF Transcript_64650/g.140794 Transcript_64650/m.140794 type:complete len:223 (+) Transcript_64650:878-1546(+)
MTGETSRSTSGRSRRTSSFRRDGINSSSSLSSAPQLLLTARDGGDGRGQPGDACGKASGARREAVERSGVAGQAAGPASAPTADAARGAASGEAAKGGAAPDAPNTLDSAVSERPPDWKTRVLLLRKLWGVCLVFVGDHANAREAASSGPLPSEPSPISRTSPSSATMGPVATVAPALARYLDEGLPCLAAAPGVLRASLPRLPRALASATPWLSGSPSSAT